MKRLIASVALSLVAASLVTGCKHEQSMPKMDEPAATDSANPAEPEAKSEPAAPSEPAAQPETPAAAPETPAAAPETKSEPAAPAEGAPAAEPPAKP